MQLPTLSPAVSDILERYEVLRVKIQAGLEMYTTAATDEADLTVAYERAKAKAYLQATGPVKEREATAYLECWELHDQLRAAVAVRRSASAAMHAREKELDVLTAALNAHNRELKVLGG